MIRLSLVISFLFLAFACKSKKDTSSEGESQDPEMMKLEMVTSDLYGGAEEEEFQVIRDAGTLSKFYRKVNMTRKPGLPVPEIDFSKFTVVLYCSGKTKTPQMPDFYVSTQNEAEMVLEKRKPLVADSLGTGMATTTPFGLYILPYTDKQVILSEK